MQLEDGQEHALQRQERRRRARATAVLNHILVDILFMAEKLSRTKPALCLMNISIFWPSSDVLIVFGRFFMTKW